MSQKTLLRHSLHATVLLACWFLGTERAPGQSPPPHPRLLFTAADVPALLAKVGGSGTAAWAYSQCSVGASFQPGPPANAAAQEDWTLQRTLRRMTELAFRYALTGNAAYGANARSLLMTSVQSLFPVGTTPYQLASYPSAIALTYDMIFPLLSASDRSAVTSHLIAWVGALQGGTHNWGGYSQYSAATDNFSFAWCTGIALSLMAVWGDASYPNIVPVIQNNLAMLRSGWNDTWSPDGSCDENIGYLNYGNAYSMLAGIAAINCGLGDPLAGTSVLKAARWTTSALLGTAFEWVGDSSPSHKGMRLDPVLYYSAKRSGDAQALWGLDRLFSLVPISDSTASQAFSPWINTALFYPHTLAPQRPDVLSGFFRDNLNQGASSGNKTACYAAIGQGGHAYLHNSADPAWTQLGAYYMIRDEWMNHSHEDDGHLSLTLENAHLYLDLGYASGTAGAQSTDQNIVVVSGSSGFNGDSTNYFTPPEPNGRFLGRKEALLLSRGADYVRGNHANMWMMQEATRTVVLIKDPMHPYLVLLDRVRKDNSAHTYEELFHAAGPAYGAGSAANPMTVTGAGTTVRATWLSPPAVNVMTGTSATLAGTTYYRNRVRGTGIDLNFLSVHGRDTMISTTPLPGPNPNTAGASAVWPWGSDKMISRRGPGMIGDAQTASDAGFVWIRSVSSALSEWIVGEGTSLVHQGQSILSTNATVVASARQGRLDVAIQGPAPSAFTLAARVPFTVSEVTVDGVSVPFQQIGTLVTVGQLTAPPPASHDRCYSFQDGFLWDALTYGPGYVTADARFASATGWAGFYLANQALLAARPTSLAMDIDFLPGASGIEGGFRLESAPGTEDVLKADAMLTTGGSFSVALWAGPTLLGSVPVAFDSGGSGGRFNLVYDPQQGSASVLSALGAPLLSVPVAPRTGGYYVRAFTGNFARLDNVTWFDSEEDGVTPQGIAYWGAPTGRVGCAMRAPQIALAGPISVYFQGQWVDPQLAASWLVASNVTELAAAPYYAAGAPLPASAFEVVFESALPAMLTAPGTLSGIGFTPVSNTPLFGLWTY